MIVVVVTSIFGVAEIATGGGEILTEILLSPSPCPVRACLAVSYWSGWGMNYHILLAFVGVVALFGLPYSLEVVDS